MKTLETYSSKNTISFSNENGKFTTTLSDNVVKFGLSAFALIVIVDNIKKERLRRKEK